jgi:hypothetical protein
MNTIVGFPDWARTTLVRDGAAAITRPPIITDLLLNIAMFSRGTTPRDHYAPVAGREKARLTGL